MLPLPEFLGISVATTLALRVVITAAREGLGGHRLGSADEIKALEEELRPWEPWEPPVDPELERQLLEAHNPTTLPQRVEAKRVLFFGTPGPETREWLYRDDGNACDAKQNTAYHTREEDER